MTDILYIDDVADDYEAELALGDEADKETIKTIEDFMGELGVDCVEDLRRIARDDAGLVADHYFTQYAMDFADSIGAIDSNAGWPLYHIDWEEAANSLKMDFTSYEYGGRTYWKGN